MKNFANVYFSKVHSRRNLLLRPSGTRNHPSNSTVAAACGCDARPSCNLTSNEILRTERTRPDDVRRRFYSGSSGPPSTKLPPLMNFPEIIWPSLIKSIRNFILATFIIKPYLDRDFNLPDFVLGAKRALEVVSTKISHGDVKDLDGLVTGEVTLSLQKSLQYMSVMQREQIAIDSADVYFSFPYQVGIMFNEQDGGREPRRFVEITMVFHALRGLATMRERGEEPPLNMGVMPEYQKRISICNYRFIREYTKGKESDWTINLLNHFKPSDHLEE